MPTLQCGCVVRCLVCGTYSIVVCDEKTFESAKKSKDLEQQQYEWYESVREWFIGYPFSLLSCATCEELSTGLTYDRWLTSDNQAVECPAVFVDWEALENGKHFTKEFNLPVYVSPVSDDATWKLAYGVGPATLEVDHHSVNRIYKPTLRRYGVKLNDCEVLRRCAILKLPCKTADKRGNDVVYPSTCQEAEYIVDTLFKAFVSLVNSDVDHSRTFQSDLERSTASSSRDKRGTPVSSLAALELSSGKIFSPKSNTHLVSKPGAHRRKLSSDQLYDLNESSSVKLSDFVDALQLYHYLLHLPTDVMDKWPEIGDDIYQLANRHSI